MGIIISNVTTSGLSSLSYKTIDLSGYPFFFNYEFGDVKLKFKNKEKIETTFAVANLKANVDLIVKSIEFNLDDDVSITSNNNKRNHLLKTHQGLNIGVVMNKSFLLQSIFSSDFDTSIQKVTYRDSGYDIFDKNIGEVTFFSRKNKFSILKSRGRNAENSYRIKGYLHSEIGSNSSMKTFGEHKLETDIEYRSSDNEEDNSMRRFYVKFHNFDLTSDNFVVKIEGELGHDLITRNSLGNIDVNIKNFDGLMSACGNLLYKSQVSILKSIIMKMGNESDSKESLQNISFSISGHERGIKYGKIGGFRNIILLMMQAGELYDSISK
ncbi:MAG: hypothetical protein K0T99_00725 [Alphaproteobacteria bacterium]|nr:hypothetical protein [Alphaproteobacteria bacterium]